jgi:hypothetical protein
MAKTVFHGINTEDPVVSDAGFVHPQRNVPKAPVFMNRRGCFHLMGLSLLLGVAVLYLTGCTASTPLARAQKNPGMLESLSPSDRELVMKSTIAEGMSKDAVFLAWGKPDAVTTGSEGGRPTETWRYAILRPVYPGLGFGLGYGYGYGYRRGGYIAPYGSFPLSPGYVPQTASVVRFKNGRVSAWETIDGPAPR